MSTEQWASSCRVAVLPYIGRVLEDWRRGSESNRRMRLLQSPALPLGYPAITARELDDTCSSGARRDFLRSIHAGHPEGVDELRRGKGCEDWSDLLQVRPKGLPALASFDVCQSPLPTTSGCTAVDRSRPDTARKPDRRLPTVCCFPIAPSHPRASSDRTSPLQSRDGVRMRPIGSPTCPPPCSARSEVRAFQSTYSR